MAGQPPVIPSLVDVTKQLGPDAIKTLVRSGKGQMRAFASATVTDDDLNALLAYLTNPAAGSTPSIPAGFIPPPIPPAAPGEVRYWSGFGLVSAKDNQPIINPPWSTLTAYDLNKGTIKWQIPLGDDPLLAAKGITNTGAPNLRIVAGIVTTGGGLIFSLGTTDKKLPRLMKTAGKYFGNRIFPRLQLQCRASTW